MKAEGLPARESDFLGGAIVPIISHQAIFALHYLYLIAEGISICFLAMAVIVPFPVSVKLAILKCQTQAFQAKALEDIAPH